MQQNRIIWQYWETRGVKPAFVDALHEIAKRNSGVDVIQVTPDSLADYVPDLPDELFEIRELAHKADMIRAMLIARHGGMWLDSDAIVLKDLNWLFDLLPQFEFVGFNDHGSFDDRPLNVRINCFTARADSTILRQWVAAQHAKFPRTEYAWTEIGTALLDPIVKANQARVRLLPFARVCPIRWNQVRRFSSRWQNARKILADTHIVMLSNKSLQQRNPRLASMTLNEMTAEDTLISDIVKRAMDPSYRPPTMAQKVLRNLVPSSKHR
jgi:hypothetical protein